MFVAVMPICFASMLEHLNHMFCRAFSRLGGHGSITFPRPLLYSKGTSFPSVEEQCDGTVQIIGYQLSVRGILWHGGPNLPVHFIPRRLFGIAGVIRVSIWVITIFDQRMKLGGDFQIVAKSLEVR
jgi:hypothetical protein